ncbi:CotH kinase family protein [Rubinisphaera italica]|uniref:CotH protein n=1 Tax=Rubinisphaera italica TaxID=2527969 RepID=A0A5C5XFX0_9PLAN|nr:CotH kinase family protein [Rubinisphaera italica]TWT61549.1 CotH protein [Rubinisphaera italica]
MNIRIVNSQIWLTDRNLRTRIIPRKVFIFVAVFLLVMAATFVIALNRSTNFKWMLHHHPEEGVRLYADTAISSASNLLYGEFPATGSPLATLELFVPRNTLSEMHRANVTGDPKLGHDPGGDSPYFSAYYRDESQRLQKSKISYRGAMHYHHWPEKPSLRVKIKKDDIALGQRYVELTRPKDALGIRHQIPEYLARELQLVSTLNEPVRLFVNRKYYGVYLRSYRPGESLALAEGRMPGTFFKGDAILEKDHLDLWASPSSWDIYGEELPLNQSQFEKFLLTLRETPSISTALHLQSLLNTERYAKYSAAMILSGCVHTDHKHNQMFYICSNQGLLEPVPWDPTCYEIVGREFTPVDVVNHPVLEHLTSNPLWVHRRNQILWELIHQAGSTEEMQEYVQNKYDLMERDLEADFHLSKKTIGTDRFPVAIRKMASELEIIQNWAKAKPAFIGDYLNDCQFSVEPANADHSETLVHVFGSVAIKVLNDQGRPCRVKDWEEGVTDLLYPGLSQELSEFEFQPEHFSKTLPYLKSTPLTYRIDAPLQNLHFYNSITGEQIEPKANRPHVSQACRTLPPSGLRTETQGIIELGPGEITLEQTLMIETGQQLVIHPGTTLLMGPGVSLFSKGLVLAEGTALEPIRIRAATSELWGCVGISGQKTRNTTLKHLFVDGGSTAECKGILFKGMFNVYDCPHVVIQNCWFGENFIGDDCVNLAESFIQVDDCIFENALSDGLDLDMCSGRVSNCQWINSGNDGLDMMGCELSVDHCRLSGCGDKGISVGEGTKVVVRDCEIERCVRGVESKDNSQALFKSTTFAGNQTAYHSYRKKWLYPRGGQGLLWDCQIRDSVYKNLDVEKQCRLYLLGTNAADSQSTEERIHVVESLPEEWVELMKKVEQK